MRRVISRGPRTDSCLSWAQPGLLISRRPPAQYNVSSAARTATCSCCGPIPTERIVYSTPVGGSQERLGHCVARRRRQDQAAVRREDCAKYPSQNGTSSSVIPWLNP